MITLKHLEGRHLEPFRKAFSTILATEIAEKTYAQILDGLPLKDVYLKSHWDVGDLPVAGHTSLCPGVLERIQEFRSELDIFVLQFDPEIIQRYQDCVPGTIAFNLRLLELVAVSCHQIAVYLYSIDDGVHNKPELESQLRDKLDAIPEDTTWKRRHLPPCTLFYNDSYRDYEQYPNGVADVVGYWAESRILGGVVLFDRGETDKECDGVYFHTDLVGSGYTIFPPTERQFNLLVGFLLSSDQELVVCPLPIIATLDNRWRWDPYEAMKRYHIFRNRYERALPDYSRPRHKQSGKDYPELGDMFVDFQLQMAEQHGEPVDHVAWDQAKENLKKITPTSPAWFGSKPTRMEKRVLWKPPYFFDSVGEEEETSGSKVES